jgi:glycosyltransferase involved in cell wall biosynthesis
MSTTTPSSEMQPDLSIVTPCFNEQDAIESCVRRVSEALTGLGITYEHILIDNASTDTTLATILRLRSKYPETRVLANEFNIGAFRSIQRGLLASRGKLVVPFLAADCQDPPELIPVMLQLQKETNCQTVAGVRRTRSDNIVIRRFRRLFYFIIRKSSKDTYREGASEFRLIESSAAKQLGEITDSMPFFRVYMSQIQGRVEYLEYEMTTRTAGKSSATFFSLVDDAMNGILLAVPSLFSRLLVLLIAVLGMTPIVFTVFWFTGMLHSLTLLTALAFLATGTGYILITILHLFIGQYIFTIHAQLRRGPEAQTREL